jgi:hypothetical protein
MTPRSLETYDCGVGRDCNKQKAKMDPGNAGTAVVSGASSIGFRFARALAIESFSASWVSISRGLTGRAPTAQRHCLVGFSPPSLVATVHAERFGGRNSPSRADHATAGGTSSMCQRTSSRSTPRGMASSDHDRDGIETAAGFLRIQRVASSISSVSRFSVMRPICRPATWPWLSSTRVTGSPSERTEASSWPSKSTTSG